jgi:hypothetical protein
MLRRLLSLFGRASRSSSSTSPGPPTTRITPPGNRTTPYRTGEIVLRAMRLQRLADETRAR